MKADAPAGRRKPGQAWGGLLLWVLGGLGLLFAAWMFTLYAIGDEQWPDIMLGLAAIIGVGSLAVIGLGMVLDELRSLRQDRWLGP